MASTHALWLCAVKDKLKDIELACPDAKEVEEFLNYVQLLAQECFSQAEVDYRAVLGALESVLEKVRSFGNDEAALQQYLVSVHTASLSYPYSVCLSLVGHSGNAPLWVDERPIIYGIEQLCSTTK